MANATSPYKETLQGIKQRRRWVVAEMQTRGYEL